MHQQEHRVREVAYHIWESEGRPHGQDARHWEMACRLAGASNEPRLDSGPKTLAKASKKASSVEPGELKAKPAKAQKTAKAAKAEEKPLADKPKKAARAAKVTAGDTTQADPAKLIAAENDKPTAKTGDKPKKSRKKGAGSEPVAENESA